MKYVLFYDGPSDREKARQAFAAHQATWKGFQDRGELLLIGPFTDAQQGAMAVFSSRDAAEAFARADPFVLQGVVSRWEVREWREAIIPESGSR
jgi:uncharacterized protein YciI